ncbi:endophilin-B1-like isoform X2 [Acanthaster planci]|uniref:Endophilin-B1-like isoform X2 n=1 Tax=Acanthaster planci TaxID=133434 RepID=A0A8B7XYT6_ACAPL|nr:endophilin-B1-like isoform X2 [Acanthaster planci]
MDKLKGFASDAGTFFNRTVQYTEEKLGSAEKTELDAQFENLQQRADRTKQWTERILSRTEAVLQPNPTRRMEDFLNTKLDRKMQDRETNHEAFGLTMIEAGNELGPGTQYGAALVQCGGTQKKLGQFEKEFMQAAITNFIGPLRNFLEADMKTITKERKILENKRLDLDAAKGKLRKAKSPESSKLQNSDDLIRTAEAELRVAQSEFDRQYEITKLLLEGISSAHSNHLSRLQYFIEAQQAYFEQCQKAMTELQIQMANIPGSLGNIRPYNPPQAVGNPSSPSAPPIGGDILQDSPTDAQSGRRKARVLYDYDASDPTELSCLADEVITVYSLPGMDKDWMMAERGSQQGRVPLTYLELIS